MAALGALVVACGPPPVPRAAIGDHVSAAPPPRSSAADPPAAAVAVTPATSKISVAGSDKFLGEHVVRFERFSGQLELGDPVRCALVIDVRSLVAENTVVGDFIRSGRFLDVARFPEARFEATRVEKRGAGAYAFEGNLSLHGVTKSVAFPVTLHQDGAAVSARADFLLSRRAFGIGKDDVLDKMIDDEVRVHLELGSHER